MAKISPQAGKWSLILIGLAGLMSILFMQSCTNVEPNPQETATLTPPTLPPKSTTAPVTPTKQPSLTPSKTATPTVTVILTPTHTPFPKPLDHYFLKYDPKATPAMPPTWSVPMWDMWGGTIPATPVEAPPHFIPYPAPANLATNTHDLFIQAGCVKNQDRSDCPPDSQLSRFDCWWIFADPYWIAYARTLDFSLVARCATRIDYWDKAPDDVYIGGCAFRFKEGYIFKIQGEYILVNTIEQMKELFVPIESPAVALSYAQMMTGLYADFEPAYDPTLLYLQESVQGTRVTEVDGSYLMNLYHTKGCGCEPWMTSEVMIQVDRDGTITWKSAIPVYFTTGFNCAD